MIRFIALVMVSPHRVLDLLHLYNMIQRSGMPVCNSQKPGGYNRRVFGYWMERPALAYPTIAFARATPDVETE